MVDKYDVAVIKRKQDFSKDTYSKVYNDFSSFLAGNNNADSIKAKAAEAGYTVQSRQHMSSAEHNVAGVRSTRDALRWIFNKKTKVGDVSQLYECGDNNHLLVVMLKGIHKKGFQTLDDPEVKDKVEAEALKDKQAAMLQEKMKDAKSLADVAKIENAISDTIKHISFNSNAFISKVGSSEPALSGAVSQAKKGDFRAGVKGNAGVYAFQVIEQNKLDGEFDQKKEEEVSVNMSKRMVGNYASELYKQANVTDHRYIFY
jgi:peptidyl-prolyl cis-trans isomerase D